MLSEAKVRALLDPFGLNLGADQIAKVITYLDLLLRWNAKINLTAIRQPEECVTRNFGESLYLAVKTDLVGSLLDIGSGAGFPGLALKITFPGISVTLLEPTAKKRAFLKEVARQCELTSVDVRPERIEDYPVTATPNQPAQFGAVTARAVGGLRTLVPAAARHLKPKGRIFAWITKRQATDLVATSPLIAWRDPWPVPLSDAREIWHGSPQPATIHPKSAGLRAVSQPND